MVTEAEIGNSASKLHGVNVPMTHQQRASQNQRPNGRGSVVPLEERHFHLNRREIAPLMQACARREGLHEGGHDACTLLRVATMRAHGGHAGESDVRQHQPLPSCAVAPQRLHARATDQRVGVDAELQRQSVRFRRQHPLAVIMHKRQW